MKIEKVQSAGGFSVGDVLRISCDSEKARVVRIQHSYVFVEWPRRRVDHDTQRAKWEGTSGFPRDPDHYEWRNTPWRMDPEPRDVRVGDLVILSMTNSVARPPAYRAATCQAPRKLLTSTRGRRADPTP